MAKVAAGKLTFTVTTNGSMPHEHAGLKTSRPAANPPVNGGRASEAGHMGEIGDLPAGTTTTLTKSGLVGLTRELASQWGRYAVRVNAVAPGFFPSDMNADIQTGGDIPPWLAERIPLARGGDLTEFVSAVRFLLAPGYITGQVLPLDGGLSTR